MDYPHKIKPPYPTFQITGPVTFNVNSIGSPLIAHWLEIQADRLANFPYQSEQSWISIANLLEAALTVSSIWIADEADKQRLREKLAAARSHF